MIKRSLLVMGLMAVGRPARAAEVLQCGLSTGYFDSYDPPEPIPGYHDVMSVNLDALREGRFEPSKTATMGHGMTMPGMTTVEPKNPTDFKGFVMVSVAPSGKGRRLGLAVNIFHTAGDDDMRAGHVRVTNRPSDFTVYSLPSLRPDNEAARQPTVNLTCKVVKR